MLVCLSMHFFWLNTHLDTNSGYCFVCIVANTDVACKRLWCMGRCVCVMVVDTFIACLNCTSPRCMLPKLCGSCKSPSHPKPCDGAPSCMRDAKGCACAVSLAASGCGGQLARSVALSAIISAERSSFMGQGLTVIDGLLSLITLNANACIDDGWS